MMFIPFPDQPGLWSAVPFGSDRREVAGRELSDHSVGSPQGG